MGNGPPRYDCPMSQILRGGRVVTRTSTSGAYSGFDADIHIVDGRIDGILSPGTQVDGATPRDVSGLWLTPGFVQAQTHLIQTLFRGMADDLALLDWLRTRIWPLESAHDEESAYWSARLGLTEMLLGGTTAILDMASVRHTSAIFQAAQECGIHAHIGKAMDRENEAGLSEATDESVASSCALRTNGTVRAAFGTRSPPVCSFVHQRSWRRPLPRPASGCLITHASENKDEVELRSRADRPGQCGLPERPLD